ncbi:MAG: DUF4238 domain-containing protein [Pseudomonadota bacterium]
MAELGDLFVRLLISHMATHIEHHYVPRFLLKQWHTRPDDKLTSFRWEHGQLISDRYKAKSVAKEPHLYSMERSQTVPNVKVEKEFWGPHIDDPAALVHAKMLNKGINGLNLEDKKAWSPFLVSLMLRGPTMIHHIRERGRDTLLESLDKDPDEFLAIRGDEPEATLREWVEKHMPDVLDDLGVMSLPELAFSEKLNLALLNVTWGIRSVHAARFDLLIGDRPLIVGGTFETSFLVALPISPTKIFFALNNEETLANMKDRDHDEFVRLANLSTVVDAERYVFATNTRQEQFVKKFLREPNSI